MCFVWVLWKRGWRWMERIEGMRKERGRLIQLVGRHNCVRTSRDFRFMGFVGFVEEEDGKDRGK